MDNCRKAPPALPKDDRIRERRIFPQIGLEKVLDMIEKKCGNIDHEEYGDVKSENDHDVVIFLPMATREFKNMVYWGEVHPINRCEQLYQGMGHIVFDGTRRIIIISHFLYLYAAERTPVSAALNNGKADLFLERVELEREIYRKYEKKCNKRKDGFEYDPIVEVTGPSVAVLYGHTHPGIGTFFSPPDKVSGFATPNLPAVTFVADPIRREMKAGVGIELRDARIIVYSYKDCENKPTRDRSKDECKDMFSEAVKVCSGLIDPEAGINGRVKAYTTLTGAQKFKAEITMKS